MFLVKVLERKIVIRLFGLALLVAPSINTILSMSLQLVPDRWTLLQFWRVVGAQGTPSNFLHVSSLIIGIAMLSGSRKSWKFALALLGGHIALQVPRLGIDLRTSWIYGVFFLVNIVTFLFIADQLAFKQKKEPVAKKTPEPQAKPVVFEKPKFVVEPPAQALKPAPELENKLKVSEPTRVSAVETQTQPLPTPQSVVRAKPSGRFSTKRVLISFEGGHPWAQLVNVNAQGVQFKGLAMPPADLAIRGVELNLPELTIKLKFSHQRENIFFFGYVNMDPEMIRLFNTWLYQVQYVEPKSA